MICPRCGQETWDNRNRKERGEIKPNAPDFKCKDKSCGWIQWPDKAGEPKPAGSPSSQPAAPADYPRYSHRMLRTAIKVALSAFDKEGLPEFHSEAIGRTINMLYLDYKDRRLEFPEKLSEKPKAIQEHEEELEALPF